MSKGNDEVQCNNDPLFIRYFGQAAWQGERSETMSIDKEERKAREELFSLECKSQRDQFFSSLRFRSIIFISCSRKFHFMIEFLSTEAKKNLLHALIFSRCPKKNETKSFKRWFIMSSLLKSTCQISFILSTKKLWKNETIENCSTNFHDVNLWHRRMFRKCVVQNRW